MIYEKLNLKFEDHPYKYLVRAVNHDIEGADSNQSGKSTLFSIPDYCLFGKTNFDKFKKGDYLREGTTEGYAETRFSIKGMSEPLRVRRGVGKSSLEFWIGDIHIEKGTPTLTQEALLTVLHYSIKKKKEAANDFMRTIGITGKSIDEFVAGSSTENANFLGRIFEQEIWDYFKEVVKKDLSENIQNKIYIYESKQIGTSSKELLKNVEEGKVKISEFVATWENLSAQKEEVLSQKASLDGIAEQQKMLKTLEKNLKTFRAGKQKELDGFKTRVTTAKNSLKELTEFLEKNKGQNTIEINKERQTKLEEEIEEIKAKKEKLETEEKEPNRLALLEVRNRLENNAYFPIHIQQLQKEINTSSDKLEHYLALLEGNAEEIIKYSTEQALNCPACKAELTLINEDLHLYDQEMEIKLIKQRLEKFKSHTLEDTKIIKTKQAFNSTQKTKEAEIKSIQASTEVIVKIEEAYKRIEELKTTIRTEDKTAKTLLTKVREEVAQLVKQIEEQTEKVNKLEGTEKLKELEDQLFSIKSDERVLKNKMEELNRDIGGWEEKAIEVKEAETKLDELYKLKNRNTFFIEYASVIKNKIIESRIPLLEAIANERLTQIQANTILKLSMSKENSKGIVNEFNPTIIRNGKEVPAYKESSGGIRRLAFSILTAALELGAASRYGYFKCDEALDTLDPTGRAQMAKLLNAIPLQGFITTHTEDVSQMFEKQILIERKDNKATARILQ